MPIPPPDLRLVLRSLALTPPCRSLLVAACADGELCFRLAEFGLRVTGIERDETRVARARERSVEVSRPVSFQVANPERTSFADRHFDAVLCFDLYDWIVDEAERWRLVDELCRVAGRHVLLGYAAPFAAGALAERLQRRRAPPPIPGVRTWRTCTLASLQEKFDRYGFRLHRDRARLRFLHSRHLATFQRN